MPEVEAHMGPLAHYEVHLDAELLHVMIVEARLAGENMGRSGAFYKEAPSMQSM